MLRELFVQNLALIEDVRVELQPGFCAWTGETGAGKSLLLGALGLLLGERSTTDLLRTGSDQLRVTGRFELTTENLHQEVEKILDAELEDSEIILSRRLNRNGRSQAYVNDQPVTLATLKSIGTILIDIHGQRETESLLHSAYQLQLLDAFGQLEKPRQKYVDLAEQVRSLRRRYRELEEKSEQRQRELSLIRFERQELEEAQLEPDEFEELKQERERLANAQDLQIFAQNSYEQLYDEDDSIASRLGQIVREAEDWTDMDSRLAEVTERLEGVTSEVQELAQTLRNLGERWESDPARLEIVEDRIELLRRLETKYHRSIEELIEYHAGLDETEKELQQQEEDRSGLKDEIIKAYASLKKAASELSKKRKTVAKKLARATQKELKALGMPDAKLNAVLEPTPLGNDAFESEVPSWGAEQLELILEANPGEPALPLRKVASGGELSRTMLALKTVLADHDSRRTLIFDEIDSNVGGRLGDVLGQKLADLGATHQVVCVTHLPQVASYAQHHWSIRKSRQGKRTTTTIQSVTDNERLEELASMLRGDAREETTRQEAAAMLKAARQVLQPK